ncbi:MAG: hypothetical protein GVY20_03440 [Bacteroidetes bacterium]|jgi:hypothetical protein|nr:hypothetical protein [Bacteroidota bacterium]
MSDTPYESGTTSTEKDVEQTNINNQQNSRMKQEDEVDIWDLVKIVWDGRIYILISTIGFLILGFFHLNFGPTGEYMSNSILLQEVSAESNATNRFLRQFGGSFGFSTSDGEAGRISPSLYPTIIESAAFKYELIFEDIEFERFDTTMTIFTFFNEHYEPPIRSKVYESVMDYSIFLPLTTYDYITNFTLFEEEKPEEEEIIVETNERILRLTPDEERPMNALTSRIALTMEGNLITVETTLPDPKAAVMLNIKVIDKIQEYVTEYQVEKARQNLEFVEQQYETAKERYERANQALAKFRDQNLNISSNVVRTEEERLQNQRNMTFNIYNSISTELERARLRLQEETPVFSVLQKSSYPTSASGASNRILAIFIVIGGFFGVAYIFAEKIFQKVVMEIKES